MKNIMLSLTLLFLFSACSYISTNTPIIIGGITPLTEQGTVFGKMMKNVADLRISQINKDGGINGRDLKVLWRDGKCDEEQATEAARDLIEKEKVKIILGGVCSQETLGAGALANAKKIFLLSPISTSPEISKLGKYSFRTMLPSSTQGRALANYVNKRRYEKVWVFQDINSYTSPIREIFEEVFQGEEVVEDIIPWEDVDLDERVQSMLNDAPDVIFINLQSPEIFLNLMTSLEKNNSRVPIITNQVGIDGLGSLAGNKYLLEMNPVGALFYVNQENQEFKEFEQQYTQHYGIKLDYKHFAGTTLDAVDILSEVLRTIDNVNNPDEIREAFLTIQSPGFSGPLIFDDNGDIRGRNTLLRYNGEDYDILQKESY